MLSHAKTKYLRALQLKKYRQKYHKFTVEGRKVCDEILSQGLLKVEEIYATQSWLEANADKLAAAKYTVSVDMDEMAKVSNFSTPQDVLMVCYMPDQEPDLAAPSSQWCLYLESLRDPGNLGTILRIADWFGVSYVYCSPDCVELYNPKVVQASMASAFRVNVIYVEIDELVNKNPGISIYGTVLEGQSIFQVPDIPLKGLCIIGNEGYGIRKNTLNHITQKVTIPSTFSLGAESLNAGIATAVILSQVRFSAG